MQPVNNAVRDILTTSDGVLTLARDRITFSQRGNFTFLRFYLRAFNIFQSWPGSELIAPWCDKSQGLSSPAPLRLEIFDDSPGILIQLLKKIKNAKKIFEKFSSNRFQAVFHNGPLTRMAWLVLVRCILSVKLLYLLAVCVITFMSLTWLIEEKFKESFRLGPME